MLNPGVIISLQPNEYWCIFSCFLEFCSHFLDLLFYVAEASSRQTKNTFFHKTTTAISYMIELNLYFVFLILPNQFFISFHISFFFLYKVLSHRLINSNSIAIMSFSFQMTRSARFFAIMIENKRTEQMYVVTFYLPFHLSSAVNSSLILFHSFICVFLLGGTELCSAFAL